MVVAVAVVVVGLDVVDVVNVVGVVDIVYVIDVGMVVVAVEVPILLAALGGHLVPSGCGSTPLSAVLRFCRGCLYVPALFLAGGFCWSHWLQWEHVCLRKPRL